jgi:hypothetical protein
VRIRLTGRPDDVDLACELLCVIGTVSDVKTYPSEEYRGQVRRYLTATFLPETLVDLGLLRPPLGTS